jgi:hypothetical protein
MAQLGYNEEQAIALMGAFPIEPHLGGSDMGEFIARFVNEIGSAQATPVNVDALDVESEAASTVPACTISRSSIGPKRHRSTPACSVSSLTWPRRARPPERRRRRWLAARPYPRQGRPFLG